MRPGHPALSGSCARLIGRAHRMRPLLAAAMLMALTASGTARGQSSLQGLRLDAGLASTINITQTGASLLGAPDAPVTLNDSGVGESNGRFALTVEQVGASPQASIVKAHTSGGINTITLKQETNPDGEFKGPVEQTWAKILLGVNAAGDVGARGAGQDVTLVQRGSHADAMLRVERGSHASVNWSQDAGSSGSRTTGNLVSTDGDDLAAYLVQGGGSVLSITNSGAFNTYGTGAVPVVLGALANVAIASTGSGNSYAVSAAANTSVAITSNGSNNVYTVATQQSGDALAMSVNGNNNTFTFTFPTSGPVQYRALAWGVPAALPLQATPVSVGDGDFRVGYAGSLYVYDAKSTQNGGRNDTAAAHALVSPR